MHAGSIVKKINNFEWVMDRDATINSKWKKQVLFGGFDIIKVLEAIAFAISRGV